MSKVVSIRLPDGQYAQLQRLARRDRRSPSAQAALLLDEALRTEEFPYVEFRDTAAGRQAFLRGHRLKVWQIAWLLRDYADDIEAVAAHCGVPAHLVRAAVAYAEAFPDEIDEAMRDNARTIDELRRSIPQLEIVDVGEAAAR